MAKLNTAAPSRRARRAPDRKPEPELTPSSEGAFKHVTRALGRLPDAEFPPAYSGFDSLPDVALVPQRVVELLFDCSNATLWRRVGSGTLPRPVRVGARSTRWRVGALRAALAALSELATGDGKTSIFKDQDGGQ